MLRRWLPLLLGPFLVGLVRCGGSSSETPFPLEPDLAMLDAGGPPRGSEYVVFTGQSAEPEPEPPPERSRQPIPEPEPEPLVPEPSPDAGTVPASDAGRDSGTPRHGAVDAGVTDASVRHVTPVRSRDAARD